MTFVVGSSKNAVTITLNNQAHNAAQYEMYKFHLKTLESADDVIQSLRTTGKLPDYYITKATAEANGWNAGKTVGYTNPGKQIGGDVFLNSEGILPSASGRIWYEADVGLSNTISRSKQPGTRLIYSNDGLLFITTDHYKTVTPVGTWQ